MPVSCGRGLTSLNQTSSPLTNSSTPKMPRPPRSSVTFFAMSRERCKASGDIAMRLPAFDIIAVHLHMADGFAEMRFDFAVRTDRAHGELGDFIIESDHALDDHPALVHAAAAGGIVPRGFHLGRVIHFGLPLAG